MRELKFRAWNKKNNIIYLSPSELRHLGSWFDSHIPGTIGDIDNIAIMQYTGIEDANGIEIYEGDILQDDDGYIDLVKYHEEGYYHAGDWDGSDFKYCKVIGNIYENPELLENTV
jgi:hypothetical protein